MIRTLLVLLAALFGLATSIYPKGAGVTLQDDLITANTPGVVTFAGGFRIPYSALTANDTIPSGSISTTDPVIVDGQTSTGGNWGGSAPELLVTFFPSFPCSPSGTCNYSLRDANGVPIPGQTALITFQEFPPTPVVEPDLATFASGPGPFVIDVLANDSGFPAGPSSADVLIIDYPVSLGTAFLETLPSGSRAIGWIPSSPPPCGSNVVIRYVAIGCNIGSNETTATIRFVLASSDCNSNCIDDALDPDADGDGIPNDCEVPVGDANAPLCTIVNAPDETWAAGTATDNRPSEDTNGNQLLDPGEDLNNNGQVDVDSGVYSVILLPGSVNLTLNVPDFTPGTPLVQFTLNLIDTSLPGSGVVRTFDAAGNPRDCTVSLIGAECHLFLGFGPGNSSTAIHGHPYSSQMSAVRWTYPVTMQQFPSFLAPSSLPYAIRPLRVEVHMWNPTMFPSNSQQWSQVVTVRGTPGGTNTVEYSGSSNGITVQCEFFSDANGVLRMRFPFQIAGM